jgi:hypothetical protein
MSWLFGYFGNTNQKQFASPESPLYSFKDTNLILFVGGNKQTSFFKSSAEDSCWAVTGVGLKPFDSGYEVLGQTEWNNHLSVNNINLKSLNGHFVAIKYFDNELKIFTDELGLRDIHIIQLTDGFGFTTRIDWLKYFIKPEIDLKEFGSRWLLQNQVSRNSIIKNVTRLVCANATVRKKSLTIEQNEWKPNFEMPGNKEIFNSVLHQLLSVKDKKISLSLSGGLDSRLLLSYLTTKNSDHWDTHTFGDSNHPDSKIASELLKSFNRKNEIFDDEIPKFDELIDLVKTYSAHSILTNPVSSILNLRFYDKLSDQNKIIIDGGFGEIWRRAFANRLSILGKNALLKKDARSVSSLLRYKRADIFTEEALVEMEKGVIEQFEVLLQDIPNANEIDPERWADIFSIRCRLTNYYAPEQARVDQFLISFMPLVQKDILNLLFGITDADKRDGKLFKQLIKKNSIQLAKIPLVKGNITHPFNSSSLSARLHTRIKNKLGLSYQSKRLIEFQSSLREFIGDAFQSTEVINYKYYDRKKLDRLAKSLSPKNINYNSEIDWFLSFELFRQGITEQ